MGDPLVIVPFESRGLRGKGSDVLILISHPFTMKEMLLECMISSRVFRRIVLDPHFTSLEDLIRNINPETLLPGPRP